MDKSAQKRVAENTANDPYQTRKTLIDRVRNQSDDQSWKEFETIYRGFIFALIRRMNIGQQDAEDIAQQVLVKVWRNLPDLKPTQKGRFRNWLSTITRNCAIDFIRKSQRNAEVLKQNRREEELAHINTLTTFEIEKISERVWRKHLTQLALKNIEPLFAGKATTVFRLSLEGVDNHEIARRLDLKPRSVSRLRLRVKEKLVEEILNLRKELE